MADQLTLEGEASALRLSTASGAGLRSIPGFMAEGFFERVAAFQPGSLWEEAWGAFEDRTDLIGAAALARLSDVTYRAHVAVVPERRRLGIGGELATVMVQKAITRNACRLVGSHLAKSDEARMLVESLRLPAARRVADDHVTVVVVAAPFGVSMRGDAR